MKVLNLQCSHQHSFEGWFASEDDFQGQLASGLVECPLCADKGIRKMPSAPRLNLGGHPVADEAGSLAGAAAPAAPQLADPSPSRSLSAVKALPPDSAAAGHAAFLKALRHVLANTEDVGERFAEEARRMHYGEMEARNIRGQTSVREAAELLEEGIEVMPLPLLPSVKETLQ